MWWGRVQDLGFDFRIHRIGAPMLGNHFGGLGLRNGTRRTGGSKRVGFDFGNSASSPPCEKAQLFLFP